MSYYECVKGEQNRKEEESECVRGLDRQDVCVRGLDRQDVCVRAPEG